MKGKKKLLISNTPKKEKSYPFILQLEMEIMFLYVCSICLKNRKDVLWFEVNLFILVLDLRNSICIRYLLFPNRIIN